MSGQPNLQSLTPPKPARELPAYRIAEAARYLQLPVATLRSWVLGRDYSTESGTKRFRPVIELSGKKSRLLSFINLAEAHVLSAFRRDSRIRLDKIRTALRYVSATLGVPHPLIDQRFETDGVALFIERLGKMVDASAGGQVVMRELIATHLDRLERDAATVVRIYPFTRSVSRNDPRQIFIDPRYAFGRPVLASCGIPIAIIAERYRAGETIDELTHDYGCPQSEIEEALRCELRQAA